MNALPTSPPVADVCIVVEGCYPFVSGGVSSWLDWLMRNQPTRTFCVVAIVTDDRPRPAVYAIPPNVLSIETLALSPVLYRPGFAQPLLDPDVLVDRMCALLVDGDPNAFSDLVGLTGTPVRRRPFAWAREARPPSRGELLGSEVGWQVLVRSYSRICPSASFQDFFWAWRNLVGSLLSILTAPVPRARMFHAISTGYAGLFAARAAQLSGCPAAITEHGIYTNERRIDLVMADWIADVIRTGPSGNDGRTDVRDFWVRTFESFARVAYANTTHITTLYGENQSMQRPFGAEEMKLRVIANGIDLEKFRKLSGRDTPHPPTVALIGRVVPIKDIEAFIAAASIVRRAIPDAEILIIGPTDEDEQYHDMCRRRVEELGLSQTVRFTGKVNILDYMARIDVLALTSISEAQPLVLLEAGAAGIPCVATDVGSCREIIEGPGGEDPPLGAGGRVVPPMDSDAIGAAIVELLGNPALRAQCGENLRRRVETSFTSAVSAGKYHDLYAEMMARSPLKSSVTSGASDHA